MRTQGRVRGKPVRSQHAKPPRTPTKLSRSAARFAREAYRDSTPPRSSKLRFLRANPEPDSELARLASPSPLDVWPWELFAPRGYWTSLLTHALPVHVAALVVSLAYPCAVVAITFSTASCSISGWHFFAASGTLVSQIQLDPGSSHTHTKKVNMHMQGPAAISI